MPEVSKTMLPARVDARHAVFSHKLVVVLDDTNATYGVLTSSVHRLWISRQCSSMRVDPTYNPALCFNTFPRPVPTVDVAEAMAALEQARLKAMRQRRVGLTGLYNLVDSPACREPDVVDLRNLHVALDAAVLHAYGWDDLLADAHHDHHQIPKFGTRWTVPPAARREIQERLLRLNLQRASERHSSSASVPGQEVPSGPGTEAIELSPVRGGPAPALAEPRTTSGPLTYRAGRTRR
jgi:hypothetical protein